MHLSELVHVYRPSSAMSSRLKSKKLRVLIAVVLILMILSVAALGYFAYRVQQGSQLSLGVPTPPLTKGCQEYTKSQGWQTVECISPEYARAHIPPPEARVPPLTIGGGSGIVGITPAYVQQNVPVPYAPPSLQQNSPMTWASVEVNMLALPPCTSSAFLCEVMTDSVWGPGGFSIQLNTNQFIGRNGDTYWYQFAAQNFSPSPLANLGGCTFTSPGYPQPTFCVPDAFLVYQNDVTVACAFQPNCGGANNPGYVTTGVFITPQTLSSSYIGVVTTNVVPVAGTQYGNLLSILTLSSLGTTVAYSVNTPDLYGLSVLGHWQQVSGTILGAGGGSQAQFPTPTLVQTTLWALYATSTPLPVLERYTDTSTAENNNLSYFPFGSRSVSGCCEITYQTLSVI